MSNVRVPGLAWAILIIVVVGSIHSNDAALEASLGIPVFYLDLAITVLIGVLKGLNLGTEELEVALDLIDRLLQDKRAAPPTGMRSSVERSEVLEVVPERPNKFARWLFG